MKKAFFSAAVALMVTVPAVLANQVTLVGGAGYGPYQTGRGGEFTLATDSGSSWILSEGYVSGLTKDIVQPGTFQTFCVENAEFVNAYASYQYTVSQGSIFTGNPLTQGAAYLYHEFQIGQLQGYTSNSGGVQTEALQEALWYFMGVGPDPGNNYVTLGNLHGGFAANDLGSGKLAYCVAVLNLWVPGEVGSRAGAAQDMLVCVPDGGLTVMLLGMGLSGLAFLQRHFRK